MIWSINSAVIGAVNDIFLFVFPVILTLVLNTRSFGTLFGIFVLIFIFALYLTTNVERKQAYLNPRFPKKSPI